MDIIQTFPCESFVVRRVISTRSNIISSKRCFVIITDTSILPNGTVIIVTKTIDTDILCTSNGTSNGGSSSNGTGGGSGSSGSGSRQQLSYDIKKLKKGYVSGIVHCSGYMIVPIYDDDNNNIEACNIHFGVHLDMGGSINQRRKKNLQKAETILTSLLRTISRLHADYSMIRAEIILDSWTIENNNTILYNHDNNNDSSHNNKNTTTLVGPSQDNDLLIMASAALSKIRQLHESKERYKCGIKTVDNDDERLRKDGWDTFYDQDGISVSELPDKNAPIGILSAFCKTDAPPHVVRNLLLEHPDVIDGLLVGRSILHRLNDQTHVQWLAYGAIWPVGARDFLIVTTEEPYDKTTNEGFIIVSTSIDDIC